MQDWIKPGSRCVCVNDDWPWCVRQGGHVLPIRMPMINEILTIRDVRPGEGGLAGVAGEAYLYFWEIETCQSSGPLVADIGWISTSFRPLQEKPTDIALLTALLDTSPATIREEA